METRNNASILSQYTIESIIGSGTFGTVYLVKSNNSQYVLKEINTKSLNWIEKQRAFNEVSLLATLKHRNIIEYKDSTFDCVNGRLCIVMEYAECGDLSYAIAKQRGTPFPERKVISWFIQISLALQYIHSQAILHRDLKTQNIFLCKDNTIKVGDFGIARILNESGDYSCTGIGTPYYLSPEICMRKPYNYKSDMWALGCILFEISALEHPFKAKNFLELIDLICKGKRKPFPRWSSNLIKDLVEFLMNPNPHERPSTEEVLAHQALQPYLSIYVDRTKATSSSSKLASSQKDSLKRSASSASNLSSYSSKVFKFPQRTVENERKPRSASSITVPDSISNKKNTPDECLESGPKQRRSPSIRNTPPTIVVTQYQSHNTTPKTVRNVTPLSEKRNMNITYIVQKPTNSAKDLNHPKVISEPMSTNSVKDLNHSEVSLAKFTTPRRISYGFEVSSEPISTTAKDLNHSKIISEPMLTNSKDLNGFEVSSAPKLTNSVKNLYCSKPRISYGFEVSSAPISTDNDCGYSSEEINRSADSSDNSVCEHSQNISENKSSILKGTKHDEKLGEASHCSQCQCHQCIIDMMWKHRIRGCVNDSGNKKDYLKLKKKLLLIFKHELFQQIYGCLLDDWDRNGSSQSKGSIQNYMKFLNYEQVQYLPLMMQLIQFDLMKLSKGETTKLVKL